MGLESATYISSLNSSNPTASDAKSQGDDHIRLLKSTLLATFPNVTGAVTPTHTELNYVDGVTSAIQTQLDAKSPLASPTFTGTPAAPTASAGTSSTQLATTAFVGAAVSAAAFAPTYSTTATAAGTTTLVAGSSQQQYFTGTTTQTVTMPVTSTLTLGQWWRIVNNSTGAVTVQSSGGNTIVILAAGTWTMLTCIATSGNDATSWDAGYVGAEAASGGSLTTSGAYAVTLTATAATNVTLPTTGTLATLAGAETLSNKTLTAPKIANAGFLADANGNELIICTTTASAVNEITLANAATGNNPTITASGGDSNVGLDFQVKGTGVYNFKATASGPADVRLFEDSDNGSNYVSLIAPASMAANRVLTLPDATDTLVGKATTDTLTNKTLTAAAITNYLSFPAVQSASAGANDLDDYEEGTCNSWSLGGTATYSDRQGNYVKIGRLVLLWGSMTVNAIGTGSTSTISGLPFEATGAFNGSINYYDALSASKLHLGLFTSGTNLRNFGNAATATSMSLDNAIFQNGSRIDFSLVYMATA